MYQDLDFYVSRQHYSWRFNSRMTYASIRNLGMGTQYRIPYITLTFFSYILYFGPPDIGNLDRAPTSTFPFYFSPLNSYLAEGLWDQNPRTLFFKIYFSLSITSWLWGCGIKPPQHLLFSLLFSSLNRPNRSWVRFPHASPFIFL